MIGAWTEKVKVAFLLGKQAGWLAITAETVHCFRFNVTLPAGLPVA